MVTRRLTGEQMTVMEVKGHGTCWFADRASEINLVQPAAATSCTSSRATCSCTDGGLRTGTTFTGLRGASQGNGLFTTTVEGTARRRSCRTGRRWCCGSARSTRSPSTRGRTSRHQGNLRQSFQSGVTFRTLMGEGGGEAFQIRFEGDGLVYVQPSERNTIGGDV